MDLQQYLEGQVSESNRAMDATSEIPGSYPFCDRCKYKIAYETQTATQQDKELRKLLNELGLSTKRK